MTLTKRKYAMIRHQTQLRNTLHQLCREWMTHGVPSSEGLDQTAEGLRAWKQQYGVSGIWSKPLLMVTATIDDGIGQGIEIITRYAEIAGLQVQSLGLMQDPVHIIASCRQCRPAILGLTILQLDSDEALAHIGHNLPSDTVLVAGGPVFKYDPEMAQRCGVTYAAANVAYFIKFLLNWEPGHGTTT